MSGKYLLSSNSFDDVLTSFDTFRKVPKVKIDQYAAHSLIFTIALHGGIRGRRTKSRNLIPYSFHSQNTSSADTQFFPTTRREVHFGLQLLDELGWVDEDTEVV